MKFSVTVWDEKLDDRVLYIPETDVRGVEALLLTMTEATLSQRAEFIDKIQTHNNAAYQGTVESEYKHYSIGVLQKDEDIRVVNGR